MVIIQGNLHHLVSRTRAVGGIYTFLGGMVWLCATLALLDGASPEACLVAYEIGGAVLFPGLLFLWLARQLDRKRLWAFYGIAAGGCLQVLLAAVILFFTRGRRLIFVTLFFCQLPAMCLLAYPELRRLRRQQRQEQECPPTPPPANVAHAIVPPPPYRDGARHR